ncbi:MAG TPA: hypothetical protein VGF45_18565 [Polyangia bacterium]
MSALLSQPTYGTQPLPPASSLLAASGQSAPAPYYGASSNKNGNSLSSYPTYGSGYASNDDTANDSNDAYGGNGLGATAAYGSPLYSPPSNGAPYGGSSGGVSKGNGTMSYALSPAPAPYPQSPSSYSQTPAAQSTQAPAAYAPSGTAPSLRNTQMYGQTLTNWQPALPVSPWGTPEKAPVIGGGVETETILRSDLKKLKSSRFKGWMYFVVLLGLSGTAAYYALGDRQRLVSDKNTARQSLEQLQKVHRETLARVRAEPAVATPGGAGSVGTPATAAPAAAAGVTSPATAKLAEDLKRAMAGAPRELAIETRGDRVVLSIETSALFSGRETDIGIGGYRTLYKFGKYLKGVKERRVAISVPSAEMKSVKNVWALAAGRGVSLGRFFTDDVGFERARVLVSVPPPKAAVRGPGGKLAAAKVVPQGRVEFALEAI